jgi:hypothetical protein
MNASILMAAAALAAQGRAEELRPGLVGEYYFVGRTLEKLPELGRRDVPRFKRVDARINFPATSAEFAGTKLRDFFVVRWRGILRAPKTALYRFRTESDDGSRLWIDGKSVVENDGNHAMRSEEGRLELAAGDHEIRVEYFEGDEEAGCVVSWEAEGIERGPIPASAFFHRASDAPTEEERRGIERPLPPPVTEEEEEAPARAVPPPADEAPLPSIHYDERFVTAGGAPPDLVARVASAFEDGASTLLTVEPLLGKATRKSRSIYLRPATAVDYVGIVRKGRRPTEGYVVYVWLAEGSADGAARARFGLAEEFAAWEKAWRKAYEEERERVRVEEERRKAAERKKVREEKGAKP